MKHKTNKARLIGAILTSFCLVAAPVMGAGVVHATTAPGPNESCVTGSTQPIAYIHANGSRYTVGESNTVAFTAAFSRDCGAAIASYEWNFGDGTVHSGSDVAVDHIYGVGSWQPTLTVTNVNGESDSYAMPYSFSVRPYNTAPAASDATLAMTLDRNSTSCFDLKQYVSDVENDAFFIKNVQVASVSPAGYNNAKVFTCAGGYALVVDNSHVVNDVTAVLSYEAEDAYGGSSNTAHITLHLAATNQAPVAGDGQLSATEDQSSQLVYMSQVADFDDPDNDMLTMTIVDGPDHGTLTHEAGTVYRYQPDANFSGTDSFVYEVSDGAKTARGTVTITVAPVNDVPYFNVAAVPAFSMNEDTTLSGSIAAAASDVDGDSLTFSSTTKGVTMNADGSFVYTPAANVFGAATINVSINDGHGGVIQRSFVVDVKSVNDAPSVTSLSAEVQRRNVVAFNAAASDSDGDSLTYTWDFGDGSTAVTTTGSTSHQYVTKSKTSFTAKVTISDGKGGVTTKTVEVKL